MRVDIEVGHTTLTENQAINDWEIRTSCEHALKLIDALSARHINYTCSVLIDDKQVTEANRAWMTEAVLSIARHFLDVDYMCAESALGRYSDDLVACIAPSHRGRLARRIADQFERVGELACSQDIAIWHLLRLGVLADRAGVMRTFPRASEAFTGADHVISVLPATLRDPEELAQAQILRHVTTVPQPLPISQLYFSTRRPALPTGAAAAEVSRVVEEVIHGFDPGHGRTVRLR